MPPDPAPPTGPVQISLIAAVSENGVIGRDNQLPWKLSSDLQRFKALTMGHSLIVGRKTFESIGRPLPGRRMIVLSRNPSFRPEGVQVAGSLPRALALVAGEDEVFVGGGEELFRRALPLAHRLYLTVVHAGIEGDSFFPPLESEDWEEAERELHPADSRNEYSSTFQVLVRRGAARARPKKKGAGRADPLVASDAECPER